MKNNKTFYCIISLISVIILIWSLSRNNLIEGYEGNSNFENTGMYVLYVPKRELIYKRCYEKDEIESRICSIKLDLENLKKHGIKILKSLEVF